MYKMNKWNTMCPFEAFLHINLYIHLSKAWSYKNIPVLIFALRWNRPIREAKNVLVADLISQIPAYSKILHQYI